MKRIIQMVAGIVLLTSGTSIAQTIPSQGSGNATSDFWSRSGNIQTTGANIFGTRWNSPIYTITGGIAPINVRMKLNGIFNPTTSPQYSINNYGWNQGVNTTGYLGLGVNSSIPGGQYLWSHKGAFSMLHLNGRFNTNGLQEAGFRPWMQAGVTFTDNQDLSYIGLRRVGSGFDITETVIAWSDNQGTSSPGPDDMVFRFTGAGNGNTTISSNLQANNDLDGLHIARFAPTGEFGLGNTFGVNAAGTPANLYVRPQSLLHLSLDNNRQVWSQYTNQTTGQTQTDGLRMGIAQAANFINGYLRWQENTPFIVQSAYTASGATATSGERMRITSIGALNNTVGNFGGLTSPDNRTRIAISADGANPITKPLSLLHLGYNTGSSTPLLPNNTDGWRNWMDLGMFTSNGTDNVYIGLKNEGTADRNDAVINWGDNQTSGGNQGPDKLRFIFTASPNSITNPGSPVAISADGLETMRIVPIRDTTTALQGLTYGRVGIGDFTAQGVNQEPTHKLDVVGNGRFRALPDSIYMAGIKESKYVMVDSLGVLRWSSTSPGGGTISGAHNGTAVSTIDSAKVAFGQDYQQINDPAQLLNNREIPMRGKNILYTDDGRMGIGDEFSNPAMVPQGKLDIRPSIVDERGLVVAAYTNFSAVPQYEMNTLYNYTTGTTETTGMGIYMGGNSAKRSTGLKIENITSAGSVFGIESSVHSDSTTSNCGGSFAALGVSNGNIGIDGVASDSPIGNTGGSFRAGNPNAIGANGIVNTGVKASSISGQTSIGLYAEASGGTLNNFAGYFNGDVYVNGNATVTSDQNLKENIQDIPHADSILNALNPIAFNYKHSGIYQRMNMPTNEQFGLIAQEVEPILPMLIKNGVYPAEYDSLGNEIAAKIDFKTMNYDGLIPILVKGHKEQSKQIDSLLIVNNSLQATLDSIISKNNQQTTQINDLNTRLTQLENCLSGVLPFLCQLSHNAIQQNTPQAQEAIRQQLSVYLSNKEAIILDQNIPNPFAEQTVINFSIPESVKSAQIHFYDGIGSLIKTVEINQRGLGSITVFGADLSSGTYMYTLVADGINVATKKMVKQ